MSDACSVPPDHETHLRKRLLNIILRNTIRSTGVPPKWIGGETRVKTSPAGEILVELALEAKCDEPRFFAYLTAFQAEFLRRLSVFEDRMPAWFGGITWRLNNEPAFEVEMPSPVYWEEVDRDRNVTARLQRALDWDQETLASHFHETEPGELLTDFMDKHHPQRQIEDLMDRPREQLRAPVCANAPTFTVRRRDPVI